MTFEFMPRSAAVASDFNQQLQIPVVLVVIKTHHWPGGMNGYDYEVEVFMRDGASVFQRLL